APMKGTERYDRGLYGMHHFLIRSRCVTLLVLSAGMVFRLHAQAQFEVASIKVNKSNETVSRSIDAIPASGRLVIRAMTVRDVIQGAYGVQAFELVNTDSPVLNQRIDIEAKAERPVASAVQLQRMLQSLLAERFKLAAHQEKREMNALALMLSNKDGRLG